MSFVLLGLKKARLDSAMKDKNVKNYVYFDTKQSSPEGLRQMK